MGFAERLKLLREERGLTQGELAKYLGLSRFAITKYENGERFPDQSLIIKIANLFNVTTDYLLGNSDYPHMPDTSKIDGALEGDIELLEFWNQLKKREDLQLLARQLRTSSPEDIRRLMRIIKAIEDEEDREG